MAALFYPGSDGQMKQWEVSDLILAELQMLRDAVDRTNVLLDHFLATSPISSVPVALNTAP
jgi:hypothetical protein